MQAEKVMGARQFRRLSGWMLGFRVDFHRVAALRQAS
jgi:hypothetical protein